jgi:hypothetical protein
MSVNGISGVRVVAVDARSSQAVAASREAPAIGEPAMGADAAASMAAGFEGLGVEALAALLAADAAQGQAKLARDEERAQAKQEHDAISRQVAALHDKASAMRSEAGLNTFLVVAGATFSAAGTCSGVSAGRTTNVGELVGKGLTQLAEPASKLGYARKITDAEADATQGSADAKEASAAHDDAAARRRAAEEAVDKAQSALMEFVQERAMARRTIFRGG